MQQSQQPFLLLKQHFPTLLSTENAIFTRGFRFPLRTMKRTSSLVQNDCVKNYNKKRLYFFISHSNYLTNFSSFLLRTSFLLFIYWLFVFARLEERASTGNFDFLYFFFVCVCVNCHFPGKTMFTPPIASLFTFYQNLILLIG